MNEIGSNGYFSSSALPYPVRSSDRKSAVAPASGDADSSGDVGQKLLEAYQKRWAEARLAIERLPRAEDMARVKKAAAAERVERIKNQIRMLMSMGMVGDPKSNARQIAQLARELAAAVREYASAGGTGSAAPVAAPTDAATDDGAATVTADAQEGEAGAENEGGAFRQTAASGEAVPAATSSAIDQYRSQLSQAGAGDDAADREFIRDVKELLAQLKALARQQAARLRQQGDDPDEASKIDRLLGDIEKTLAGIDSSGAETAVAVSVSA